MDRTRLARRRLPLLLVIAVALGSGLSFAAVAGADTLSGPGPFDRLAKGDAWFFNRGFSRCWIGTSPRAGCPENTVTLKLDGREYFVLGETKDRIDTPNLGYVRFQAPDPLQPCDLRQGCYGHAVACSAVRYQLIVDGKVVVTTGSLGPTTTTGVLALPRHAIRQGLHSIRVRMLGNPTGCAGNEDTQGAGPGGWLARSWGVALWLWSGPPQADIAGVVIDDSGIPVANLDVYVSGGAPGAAKTYTGRTNAMGGYALTLPTGDYTVTPRTTPGGSVFAPASTRVRLSSDVENVNFVRRHDELDLRTQSTSLFAGVDWTRVQASGTAVESGFARLTNARGEPRAGQLVKIDTPYWDGHPAGVADPRLLMCDSSWNRVYPGAGFERTTDNGGRIDFTAFFGGEPGNWWLRAAAPSDTLAFDLLRVAQAEAGTGPDARMIDTIQQSRKLGLPPAPLDGASLAQVQTGLLEWLLAHWTYGPLGGSPAQTGAFGPIRNAAGSAAGIVFYPANNPGPIRAHLERGTPLPYPGYAFVIPFKHVALPYPSLVSPLKHIWYADFGGSAWKDPNKDPPAGKNVPTLGQWEGVNGPARMGYANARPNEALAWFGAPYPPPIVPNRLRLRYEHCAPGAAPATDVIEAYSPVRLMLTDSSGLRFGLDAHGNYVNTIGGFVERRRGQPDRYVVPAGNYTAALTGTGNGRATLVVSGGERTSVFAFAVRRGARGSLAMRTSGVPASLRFAGRTVRARRGIGLSLRAQPRSVRAKRFTTLRLRVLDQFGAAAPGVTVAVRGPGVKATVLTDARGTASVALWPTKRGRLLIAASAAGYASASRTVVVKR